MTGCEEFLTYCRLVPSIGVSTGSPSYLGAGGLTLEVSTWAVWGTLLAIIASWAWTVPGTEALTFSLGLSSGIFAKSPGSSLPGTYCHGPCVVVAANHRPAMST